MRFKEWFHEHDNLLLEDFKTSKKRYIDQGYAANTVDEIIRLFRTFKDRNYRELFDELPNFGIRREHRKDIDKYVQFSDLERIVSHVLATRPELVQAQQKKPAENEEEKEEIYVDGQEIYNDNLLEISVAYKPSACIRYKGEAFNYSWCVSRKPGEGNMYYSYRYGDEERTFYFVKNKTRLRDEFATNPPVDRYSIKDVYHFFVLQVLKGAIIDDPDRRMNYRVTSAKNDGDTLMSWNQIVTNVEPLLAGKQNLFQYIPLTTTEKELYTRFKNRPPTDEEFAHLTYDEKDKYVSFDFQPLTNSIFAMLPDSLKNNYITMRTRALTIEQFGTLTSNLQKRYLKTTPFQIADEMFMAMNDDVKQFYISQTDKLLTDEQYNSMNDEMKEIYRQSYKQKIINLLRTNPENISKSGNYAKEILINGLRDGSITFENAALTQKFIHFVLEESTDDFLINKIIDSKFDFTKNMIKQLLLKAKNAKAVVAKLGSSNMKKLEESDIIELIGSADDQEGIIKGILKSKDLIKNIDIDELCKFRKRQLQGEFGRKIKINCDPFIRSFIVIKQTEDNLTEDDIYKSLRYAKNPIEIRSLFTDDDINNLGRNIIFDLIHDSYEQQAMGQALGQNVLNKLTSVDVYKLIQSASTADMDMTDLEGTRHVKIGEEAMAKILGTRNIEKINDRRFMTRYRISQETIQRLLRAAR
jgi:hypothetical protein